MTHFLDTDNCVKRLYKEYVKNKRLIVAIDFDDTVYDYSQNGSTFDQIIQVLKRCKTHNFYIVSWTASAPERYPFIKDHLSKLGIEVDSFNENPIPLPFGNHKKIYYNILLDDRAGLSAAVNILTETINFIEMVEYRDKQIYQGTTPDL